jgi:ATP-dependent DNA helicase HFM1/MER3
MLSSHFDARKFGRLLAVRRALLGSGTRSHLVRAAPTGAGKTVLFELAIIRMHDQEVEHPQNGKCVYIAPTKVSIGEE